jgi:hypothetical protein
MADQTPGNAIVTYRSFGTAFAQPTAQQLAERTPFESTDTAADETALRAQLSDALAALEREGLRQGPGMMTAVQHQFASLLQSHMLEQPPPGDLRQLPPARSEQSAFEVKYDEHDILGWVGSVFTWWKKITPEPWRTAAPQAEPIGRGRQLRVALLADWGTGLYGAPVCARSIAADANPLDLLLHLGDVYYSGTQREVRTRFLNVWPSRAGAISRACNANHEMYTGGEGYFREILPAFQQPASYFALQNEDWLLVGLDSAYIDHDLAGEQVAWLDRILAAAGSRRVVLFSHHQPYSLLDSQGPKLVAKLGHLLGKQRIFAWYWGHEHRCVLYDRHPAWNLFGRCIGHGGYPYFRDATGHLPLAEGTAWRRLETKNMVPGGLLLDAPNRYVAGEEERYGANGYLTLEFDGAHLTEVVHDPDGSLLRTQQLV